MGSLFSLINRTHNIYHCFVPAYFSYCFNNVSTNPCRVNYFLWCNKMNTDSCFDLEYHQCLVHESLGLLMEISPKLIRFGLLRLATLYRDNRIHLTVSEFPLGNAFTIFLLILIEWMPDTRRVFFNTIMQRM